MKARLKFQKFGTMKFVGHLDIMRYFQKAFRRAGIDNEYSKGYNPHQIMSFASPLGLGLTSDGEYLDVQLLSSDSPEVMIERINKVMVHGFKIIDFYFLKDREENQKKVTAMSLVSSGDYLISLKDGYSIDDRIKTQELFQKEFQSFMDQKEMIINKKTKTQEMEVDIRPLITMIAYTSNEYERNRKETLDLDYIMERKEPIVPAETVADVYENGIQVYLQVDTGSASNLKPELVMEEFCKHMGIEFEHFAWQTHRIELYTRLENSGKLVPLNHLEQ